MFTRASNVVLANILSFMQESAWNRGQQQKFCFSTFIMCLKLSGRIKVSRLPEFFEYQDFSKMPKMFGHK
jgi:hypothetical protein